MKTLNHVVLVLVLASFGFASFGCGDDSSSPVAPSTTPMAEAPSYAPAGAPGTPPVRPASLSPDVDTVAPGDARYGPNAYDFFAHMDSGMLRVALVEDAMATMRTASQPHRMRQVEVYHVISEPRHVLQTHGDPLYSGTVRLSGRLELPPIAVESCAPHEWIVVQAAELSDDRYDGWRNAPCPQPGGVVVGSDGSGPGWERSEHGAPSRDFPPEPEADPTPAPTPDPTPAPTPDPTPAPASEHAQRVVDREIADDPLRQRGDHVQFPVRNLFRNPVGTNSYHFPVRSSDESVATARIVTDNPEIRITATGFGTTTITVEDTRAEVSVSFVVSVSSPVPTPTPTPMPEPTPTPMPMPEPTPNPILPGTLPVSWTDPMGDLNWVESRSRNDGSRENRSYDGGPRPSTDLIKLTLSDQDPDGWIRVTFTLAGHFDEAAIQSAMGGHSSRSIIEISIHPAEDFAVGDFPWETFNLATSEHQWRPGFLPRQTRSLPGRTGTTISYEINPSRELRGVPLRMDSPGGRFASTVNYDDGRSISTVDWIRGLFGDPSAAETGIVIPYGVTVPFRCDAISPDRCHFVILREGRERQYFTLAAGDNRNVEHVMPGVDSYAVIVMGPVRRADTIPGTRPPEGWEDDICTTEEERTTPVGVDWCKRATINARYNN